MKEGTATDAELYLRKYLLIAEDEFTNGINIPFDKVVKLIAGYRAKEANLDNSCPDIDYLEEGQGKEGDESETELWRQVFNLIFDGEKADFKSDIEELKKQFTIKRKP